MNKNIFIGILIVVIAGASWFAYTQYTSDPPPAKEKKEKEIDRSNWKTYENEKYGFSIQYPPEITASAIPGDTGTWVDVWFEGTGFKLRFFEGMREVGGYIGAGTVWEKTYTSHGIRAEERLIRCEDNDVTVQIFHRRISDNAKLGSFDSLCFDQSFADSYVPQIEAIAKTLKYTE